LDIVFGFHIAIFVVITIAFIATSIASAAFVRLLLPLLLIFLLGAAAIIVAFAAFPAGLVPASGAGLGPPCASDNWINATS
jgi:hypothetical protein